VTHLSGSFLLKLISVSFVYFVKIVTFKIQIKYSVFQKKAPDVGGCEIAYWPSCTTVLVLALAFHLFNRKPHHCLAIVIPNYFSKKNLLLECKLMVSCYMRFLSRLREKVVCTEPTPLQFSLFSDVSSLMPRH
jgi:hypothetical protein